MIAIVGCAEYQGDTTNNDYASEYYYTENNIDYGSGTNLFCNESYCSVDASKVKNDGDENNTIPDAEVGVYNSEYNQVECQSAGFFWCTIDEMCLNQRVDDSSSSCDK